jgi:PEGA domain
MRLACSLLLSTLLTFSGFPAFAQAPQENKDQQPPPKTEPVSLKQPLAFGLEDGTPIKLRLTRNLSSADATTGDRVDFEVLEDIKVKDVIVVPRGGLALATVTEAQHKRRMARGGKLDVNIDDVRLIDGEKAPLRAVKEVKGGGHTGAMTGAMIGTAIVFFPAAPLFLFMHGKDITIPKGTEVTAYINGDIPLDPVRFQPKEVKPAADPTTAQPSAAPAISANGVDSTLSSVDVKSTPDGADITVDDKYMGSTPSTLKLAPGDHKVKLEKSGFKVWERTLAVGAGGNANVNATLDRNKKTLED